MKTQNYLLLTLFMLFFSGVHGQYTWSRMNWYTSFTPVWPHGALTGTAVNIDGSGVTATVNITKGGGSFMRANPDGSGAQTPTTTGSTYTAGTFSPPNTLMVAIDHTNASGYVDIDITFTPGIHYLSFYMGDIDRYYQTRSDFVDQLIVEANGKTVSPTFTRYLVDPSFPNQLVFSGDTVRVNPNANISGNAGSAYDVNEHGGTVLVEFGHKLINNIRIRYNNHASVIANPSYQAISISDMRFTTTFPLAFDLISFRGNKENEANVLEWKAEKEATVASYIIEHSTDGQHFSEIGRKAALGTYAPATYRFADYANIDRNSLYRIKMIGTDGSVGYSKVLRMQSEAKSFRVHQVYPSQFSAALDISMTVPEDGDVAFSIFNLNGALVSKESQFAVKGSNHINLKTPQQLMKGMYILQIRFRNEIENFKVIKK